MIRVPDQRPAVFLDRDGTVIEFVDYLCDPAQVRLVAGAGEALRKLHAAGFACVLVTNQSGVGRGMFPESAVHAVHDELARQLAAEGVALDAVYYCLAAPAPTGLDDHPDRKPNPGMLMRAAADLNLDLPASWMVGDGQVDLQAGRNAGCRGSILVRSGKHAHDLLLESDSDPRHETVPDLLAAAELILARSERNATHEVGTNVC
jgi:D-glycero-D-manno-heptose 1,7-bisphosphate phosphatase